MARSSLLIRCYAGIAMAVLLISIQARNGLSQDRVQSPEWKVGYWVWGEDLVNDSANTVPVDLLYVRAGGFLHHQGWPNKLPKAAAYFAVWRHEDRGPLDESVASKLARNYQLVKEKAGKAGQPLLGMQLDYDCPTNRLKDYGQLLQKLRQQLPGEDLISITALLDWFRPNTDIAEVLKWVDEYVPQFYDVDPERQDSNVSAVSNSIDASRWGSVFNSFSRPYRIGIACFGRIVETRHGNEAKPGQQGIKRRFVRSQSPLEVMREEQLVPVDESVSPSGEAIRRFQTGRKQRGSAGDTGSVDGIEMVFPAAESIRSAYTAAKSMGGRCSGVVFFRWPAENESMVLAPDEIRRVIDGGTLAAAESTLQVEEGFCATTYCVDLYLRPRDRFSKTSTVFVIRGSREVEYFVSTNLAKVAIHGPSSMVVELPAYPGLPRIHLGRVVTREAARFVLEEKHP